MAAEAVELEIPARPEYVALARLVVSALAATDGALGDEQVDDLKIAVSEACTNAIEAHAAVDAAEHIVVRCWTVDGSVWVAVDDRGPGFDPDALQPHPPVTDPARLHFERGLGIPLMRALADEVAFRARGPGTTVELSMRPERAPVPGPGQGPV